MLLEARSADVTLQPSRPVREKRPAVVCRRMIEADFDAAVGVLTRGFPDRSPSYWLQGLQRMRSRPAPDAYPRYGYVMTADDRIVGVILVIFSDAIGGGVKGNVSSWYVEPDFRGFSHMLLAIPLRFSDVTFINISPTPGTIDTITAQGFRPYVQGTFHAFPALKGSVRGIDIREILPEAGGSNILARYSGYGCLSFEVTCADGVHPFVFQKSRMFHDKLSCAQLVHCQSVEDFVRFAGPLGRHLLRRGYASVILDATGPIPGLPGRYLAGRRLKFYRGKAPPMLNDLGDTELVLFGL